MGILLTEIDPRLVQWLEMFSLDEILEESGLTELEVLDILFNGGHLQLPQFLEEEFEEEEDELRP